MMDHLKTQEIVSNEGDLAAQSSKKTAIESPYFWLVVAIVNILFVGWIYATVHVKHDYEAFYSAGRAFLENPQHVFEPAVQFKAGGIWKSESETLPFYHLPTELIIFAPLSLLSYERSLLLWRLLATGALLLSGWILSKTLDLPVGMVALTFLAFVPAILCVGEGQDSTLLLLILVGTYSLLHFEKQELAGALLAFGIFKPQVVCIVALALLISRRAKFFVSFVIAVGAMLGALTLYLGTTWIGDLSRMISAQEATQSPTRMVSLHGLISLLTQTRASAVALVVSAFLVILGSVEWNKSRNLEITFGSAVLVGSLTAFHFHIYDAAILLLPIAILCKLGTTEWDRYAIVVFFVSPIVVFLMAIHFTSAIAISAIVFVYSYRVHFRRLLHSDLL